MFWVWNWCNRLVLSWRQEVIYWFSKGRTSQWLHPSAPRMFRWDFPFPVFVSFPAFSLFCPLSHVGPASPVLFTPLLLCVCFPLSFGFMKLCLCTPEFYPGSFFFCFCISLSSFRQCCWTLTAAHFLCLYLHLGHHLFASHLHLQNEMVTG